MDGRKHKALAVALSAVLVSSGCATNGLASLPLPAPGIGSGGYLDRKSVV